MRILIPGTPLGSIAQSMQDRLSEETGQPIQFVPHPPETIEFTVREDARTGRNEIDGAIVPMWHIGGFLADSIIQPLDDLLDSTNLETTIAFDDEFAAVARLRSFGPDRCVLPIDGDCQLLYYQRDVVESEALQAEFEATSGSQLDVPVDWASLLEITEWYASRDAYAVALNLADFGSGVMPFLGFAAAWATPVDDPSQFWFDRESFAPSIDSARHVEALAAFQALASTGSPYQRSWYLPDAWTAFLNGEALFTIAGPDLLTSAIDRGHPNRDRIGVAPLPGVKPSEAGVTDSAIQFVGNALGPCWGGVVRSTARHPDAVLTALASLANTQFQHDRGWSVDDGVDPARRSQLIPKIEGDEGSSIDAFVEAGFTSDQAIAFSNAVELTLDAPGQLPYLRIPGAFDYMTALERRTIDFLAGRTATPAEALALAAADFESLSNIHGVERQHEMYLTSVS